ncbi:hypothetical protein IEZ26_12485 [Nocardioides cavernae]|uniref:VCBS repeat-containing protein n=1 Tax=Nocardioides cavernae TaxID=1921566 RepID=A0ABR8NCY0_9ACTN|nr:hypothetical protein [Nocardioides cavernae]MBD3925447.1 hypothetical protein [Nocardioides cavernae]MBM7514174.1 hypothetical protein [Nocardioides cavernae]
MSTPDTMSEMEDRLRAALAARAEQVRPEHLAPLSPVVQLRPRWQSPWVLLATAAVVLLVLGVVLQGLSRNPRSDDVAPKPDAPKVEVPSDVGRNWERNDSDRQPRLDLDGDGSYETVVFRGEPTKDFDGRYRLETTLSSTGEVAYGIAELGTTIATNVLDPIDADGDGDQELVLYHDDFVNGGYPLVFDLRDGLLVQAVAADPELLLRGEVPVPGTRTAHYEMVRIQDYWLEGGRLWSSRSVNSYAAGNMTLARPRSIVLDTWSWQLTDAGVLVAVEEGCVRDSAEGGRTPCEEGAIDDLPTDGDVARQTFGPGEGARFEQGYRYTARIEDGAPPVLVVESDDGPAIRHELEVDDPRVSTVQPISVMSDGASFLVTSASDPSYVRVLAQDGDRLQVLEPVGEVELADDDSSRTWLTSRGGLVTAVADDDGTWRTWGWQLLRGGRMTGIPTGTVCFDDPTDPSTVRRC